jgi:hypothetical protein
MVALPQNYRWVPFDVQPQCAIQHKDYFHLVRMPFSD